jgi:aspartate kinase
MLVMKFGGSSVANRVQIEKVLDIVRSRVTNEGAPVVVSSAHKGITDALVNAGKTAARGEKGAAAKVIARQREIAESLGVADEILAPLYRELEDLLRGVELVREMSPRVLDYVSSFGERMSVRAIAAFFTAQGLASRAYDVWDLGFVTDACHGAARPLTGYEAKMKAAFAAQVPPGIVPIVTGFVGKTESGDVTTVGRNGSDLTATLVAAALDAREVEIWSDTDGVMSADPHVVKEARNIPAMSFGEAAELAYFGSRVLHPETLMPAMKTDVPVRVLNTNRPEHPGTVIQRSPEQRGARENPVTSIAYKERQCVLTVSSPKMLAQPGYLSEIFGVAAKRGVVVDVVATSEISVSLTANDEVAIRAAAEEMAHFGDVQVHAGKTILAVVGREMPVRAGAGAGILKAIADAGVNVEMVSYAEGSINFSVVIDDKDVDRTVRALHGVLFS